MGEPCITQFQRACLALKVAQHGSLLSYLCTVLNIDDKEQEEGSMLPPLLPGDFDSSRPLHLRQRMIFLHQRLHLIALPAQTRSSDELPRSCSHLCGYLATPGSRGVPTLEQRFHTTSNTGTELRKYGAALTTTLAPENNPHLRAEMLPPRALRINTCGIVTLPWSKSSKPSLALELCQPAYRNRILTMIKQPRSL